MNVFSKMLISDTQCLFCYDTNDVRRVCEKCTFSACYECVLSYFGQYRDETTCPQCREHFCYQTGDVLPFVVSCNPSEHIMPLLLKTETLVWPLFLKCNLLSEASLYDNIRHFDWKIVSKVQPMSPKFYDEYWQKCYPDEMIYNTNLPRSLGEYKIRPFNNIESASTNEREMASRVLASETMSEVEIDICKKLYPFVAWHLLSRCCILTIEFVREFSKELDWVHLSRNIVLSDLFLDCFQDKIDWDTVLLNKSWTKELVDKYDDKIDWPKFLSDGIGKKFKPCTCGHNLDIFFLTRDSNE